MTNTDNLAPKRQRRMAREPQPQTGSSTTEESFFAREPKPSKLDLLQAMLVRDGGASIAEIMLATAWQQHSVRGAMAGALRKRGLAITSEKIDGTRRYRASKPS
ncbi:DUF3489 domain-containing protein [Tsuneonella troitsensis]|uniref:DUF3489 domain-containing protein n=1 Tax=Tsuneonella troitsensis TaxID=292222 RepID=UPI00070BA844|nr:DUF3489 domain-containing protein [Tsuneonella troitsensis]